MPKLVLLSFCGSNTSTHFSSWAFSKWSQNEISVFVVDFLCLLVNFRYALRCLLIECVITINKTCFLFKVKPKLQDWQQRIDLVENISYILQCNVLSGSNVYFEWSKDNLKVAEDDSIKVDNYKTLSSLSFKSLHRNHSGTYSCRVKNAFGSDSTSTQLLVKGQLQFTFDSIAMML